MTSEWQRAHSKRRYSSAGVDLDSFDSRRLHRNDSGSPSVGPQSGPAEVADLTRAIASASAAAQWDVVRMLARQLEKLTLDAAGVIDLEAEARKRGRR